MNKVIEIRAWGGGLWTLNKLFAIWEVGDTSSLRFWTAELKHLNFKKNPDEKYFFIMEKNDFEKKIVTFFWKNIFFKKSFNILPKKITPSKKNLRFFFSKKKVRFFFSTSFFSMMKKYFSSGFFLKFKRKFSAIQRTQAERLGVPDQETTRKTKQWHLLSPALKSTVYIQCLHTRYQGAQTKIGPQTYRLCRAVENFRGNIFKFCLVRF